MPSSSSSFSESSSSSSESSRWKDSPVIIARAECFETDQHVHLEERNPYYIAREMAVWCIARDSLKLKITINGIRVHFPKGSIGVDEVEDYIFATIHNEQHFLTQGDFEWK